MIFKDRRKCFYGEGSKEQDKFCKGRSIGQNESAKFHRNGIL